MEIKNYMRRVLPVFLMLLLNTLIGLGNTPFLSKCEKIDPEKKATPLKGGCATPLTQYVLVGTQPNLINCSDASGGPIANNSYVYQWQWSTDNVHFQDIPNATSYYLPSTNNQPYANSQAGTTIYVQRKVTCGIDVQYSNSCSLVYVTTLPIFARLEVNTSEYNPYDGEYNGEFYEKYLNWYVSSYIRFYADAACTVPMALPASINCKIRACRYYENDGYINTNECSVEPWYDVTVTAGSTQFANGDLEDFEYYYMVQDAVPNAPWRFVEKSWSDYELIVAENCIIMPPVYPSHSTGFGIASQQQ
ncbi:MULTISPECIES: hypothetical protein [Niastella]|uniref:Ig-like domain-containing protein n=1 Tax=Niastella soli TaxID=2821487 RepID=A0ABS3Z4Z8_9BACT|nr:hypothetical protein [Niastella soli]MBO9205229.1 hypothetical protein [Niastella soli]